MSEYTIIGCGDIGLRVARKLRAQNHSVEATAHFVDGVSALESEGLKRLSSILIVRMKSPIFR